MAIVVFTGSAEWNGRPITRDSLKPLVEQRGYTVANKVTRSTSYLVASRHNTQKAKDAMAMGVRVIDYPAFQRMVELGSPAGAPWTPPAAPPPPPKPIDTAAMEQLDGFGMF